MIWRGGDEEFDVTRNYEGLHGPSAEGSQRLLDLSASSQKKSRFGHRFVVAFFFFFFFRFFQPKPSKP